MSLCANVAKVILSLATLCMYKNVHVHVSQKYCKLHVAIELLVKNHVSDRMSSPCERPLVFGHVYM